MAKSEAGTEINRVDLYNSIRSRLQSINTVFGVAILRNEFSQFEEVASYVGWIGGVWCWIFFFHRFQLAFTFKTVFKALDHNLHFV